MRRLVSFAAGLLMLAIATPTLAEVKVRIQMGFPAVLPPLVEVQPGVRVVQDFDEEVFFVDGFYWVQRDGNWYRTRDHRGYWRYARPERVPQALVSHQPGQYRRWQHDERRAWPERPRGHERHWRASDRQERRGEEQRHDEGNGRGHDEGNGRGHDDGNGRGGDKDHGHR